MLFAVLLAACTDATYNVAPYDGASLIYEEPVLGVVCDKSVLWRLVTEPHESITFTFPEEGTWRCAVETVEETYWITWEVDHHND